MVKASGGTAHLASTGKADPVLATKLHVPTPQQGFVPRPRLIAQVDEGLARGLILVCAPAGFGKSSLLADWSRRGRQPVAWLSVDPGDNDPARLWRHVVAAMDRIRPGMTALIAPLLGPPPPPTFEGLVTVLINALAEQPGDVVLVLDDYDLIETEAVRASVSFLIEHRPPSLHLVLACRADPLLPLARLRARGKLAELRAAELRFTADEAAALLDRAVGPDLRLPATDVEALATRTEGWAAGLQLAALSLQDRSDAAGFVETFSGSHRHVLDYLTEEVLERQPEPMRTFLLETSVLERLSGGLCDAVTGRRDGQEMLEAIERANLFLVSLDDVRSWWRYHRVFADLLRVRMQHLHPERALDLHRNAAAWHEEHGQADDAVRHALDAGDQPLAIRLVERHFDALYLRSQGATLERWLAPLDAELVERRPRLLMARALLAGFSGHLDEVEATVDAAERALADAPDEPYEPSVGRAASGLTNVSAAIATERAYLCQLRGDAERTASYAARALAELGDAASMQASVARGHLAIADWLRGHVALAERAFSALFGGWLASGEPTMTAWGCLELGQMQRAQGRLEAALETYQQTLAKTAPMGRPALPVAGVAYVGMAELAYERNGLEDALRLVVEGIGLCRQLAYTQPLANGLAALAWIRRAMGDAAGASDAIAEARDVAPGPQVVTLLNPVPARWAQLLLAQGEIAVAAAWTEERGLGAADAPGYRREREYLVLARVLIAQDQPDQAVPLLDRLHADATAQDRTGSLIEIRTLGALALANAGDEADAVAALTEALILAHPQRWLRVFVDEGPPMAALLGRLAATQDAEVAAGGVPLDYLGALLGAFEADAERTAARRSGRAKTAVIPGLVEPLSERELEVLHLLAAGRANREIAAELYVTLDTVKKHVTHILGKLGVANRTQAAARARSLGLLT